MDMVKKAAQLHTLISWKLQELSDGEAVQMPDLYPLWEAGTEYPAQALVYHGDCLFRVEQAHTAQAHQPPDGEGLLALYRPLRSLEGVYRWLYGEAVEIGTRRMDPADGLVYEVIAPAGANIWEPHTVPAIWRLAEAAEEPDEIAPEYPAEEAV